MKSKRNAVFLQWTLCLVMLCTLSMTGCASKNRTSLKQLETTRLTMDFTGVTVQTLEGEQIALDSLWADRRIALTFLRHFG